MKIIYRISDGGNAKNKPHYITKRGCFLHFLSIFKNMDIYIVADNVSEETYQFLAAHIQPEKIFRTSLYNSASFLYSVDLAIRLFPDDEEKVYLAEDDYLYLPTAPRVIEEGLSLADYSSGYDHPDKYMNHSEGGPNPFIEKGGELSHVMRTQTRHWKYTNSCCMTFATTIRILKQDREIYHRYCQDRNPSDFPLFCDLLQNHGRKLVSCLPGVSTHGEVEWLTPFVDWEEVMKKSVYEL
jgi:hypothetical protein